MFCNGSASLPRGPSDFKYLHGRAFENVLLADELFSKALRTFETCLSVRNNLRGKLVLSLEWIIIFDESLRVRTVACYNLILIYQVRN